MPSISMELDTVCYYCIETDMTDPDPNCKHCGGTGRLPTRDGEEFMLFLRTHYGLTPKCEFYARHD